MKKDKIYKKIKQDIISGNYKEGDKLPTEFECTDIYNVSRDTVRNAFKMLEDEGFIERVKSKGTFVHLPSVDMKDRTVYFLVPCYEYLHCSSEQFQQIMFALIAECAVAGWHLIPVIFSKTNDNTDIWWENLSRFNSNSKIVVYYCWFSTYFQTLAAIDAKVAFIHNDGKLPEEWQNLSANWGHFVINDCDTGKNTVEYLYRLGCRKTALIMPDMDNPFTTVRKGFREAIKRHNMECCILDTNLDNIQQITDFYQKEKFDSAVIHTDEYNILKRNSLHSALNLPDDMPLISIPLKNSNIFATNHENIGIVRFPIHEIAHDIVQYFLSPQKKKKRNSYSSDIVPPGEFKNIF